MCDNTSQERGSTRTRKQNDIQPSKHSNQKTTGVGIDKSNQGRCNKEGPRSTARAATISKDNNMNMNKKITKARTTRTTRNKSIHKYSNPYMFIKQQCESAGKDAHKQVSPLYHHQNLCSTCFSTKRESSLFELHVKRGSHDPR